jgi:hypothetical protein
MLSLLVFFMFFFNKAEENIYVFIIYIYIYFFLCHHSECTYGFYATRILTWGFRVFNIFLFSF